LGISQWQSRQILRLATVTGVYGISYLVVATNLAVAAAAERWWVRFWRGQRVGVAPEILLAAALLLPVAWLAVRQPVPGQPAEHLRVVAVQGCMPQCRQWRQEQLDEAIDAYTSLSRQLAHPARPDLIVWPETAVPAPALWNDQYKAALAGLFRDVATSFLIGSVDYRPRRDKPDEPLCVNSALLFTPRGEVLDYYDKTHLVPVGEYTPLESLWPWLTDWIGMGRSLTPGAEFTVFSLPRGIRAGVNICFEDAFPAISRQFVLRGATLLFTLTNDAWYAESAGSRQHLTHAVLRAVENARPLLRSGNNSDTCLILPDGTVSGLLLDPQTGNRFLRAARAYDVPVWTDAPLTFYTRHGDVFAHACAVAAAAFVLALGHNWLSRKRDLWLKGSGQAAPSVPHAADSAGGGSTPTA
jgi:apolipoprotein N-acyltransferase